MKIAAVSQRDIWTGLPAVTTQNFAIKKSLLEFKKYERIFTDQNYVKETQFQGEKMIITADERRRIFNLFNVAEAARIVGTDVDEMHREVRRGNLPAPKIQIGKRRYYSIYDLRELHKKAAIDE